MGGVTGKEDKKNRLQFRWEDEIQSGQIFLTNAPIDFNPLDPLHADFDPRVRLLMFVKLCYMYFAEQ